MITFKETLLKSETFTNDYGETFLKELYLTCMYLGSELRGQSYSVRISNNKTKKWHEPSRYFFKTYTYKGNALKKYNNIKSYEIPIL